MEMHSCELHKHPSGRAWSHVHSRAGHSWGARLKWPQLDILACFAFSFCLKKKLNSTPRAEEPGAADGVSPPFSSFCSLFFFCRLQSSFLTSSHLFFFLLLSFLPFPVCVLHVLLSHGPRQTSLSSGLKIRWPFQRSGCSVLRQTQSTWIIFYSRSDKPLNDTAGGSRGQLSISLLHKWSMLAKSCLQWELLNFDESNLGGRWSIASWSERAPVIHILGERERERKKRS